MSRGAPNPARGLTSAEAARRLAEHGPNRMPPPRRASPVLLLLREMVHFFALLLWAAAGLALLAGMPQLAVAIVVIVLINGGFAFAQEYRADRAAVEEHDHRSEEHTSELQSRENLVCRLLLEKKK